MIPVKKLLQLMVQDSQLVIDRSLTKQNKLRKRSLPNPCFSKTAKTMLFIRFSYKGIEHKLTYDFNREKIILPNDVI